MCAVTVTQHPDFVATVNCWRRVHAEGPRAVAGGQWLSPGDNLPRNVVKYEEFHELHVLVASCVRVTSARQHLAILSL